MTSQQFITLLQGFKHQTLTRDELFDFLDAAREPRFESLLGEEFLQQLSQELVYAVADTETEQRVWNSIKERRNDAETTSRPAHHVHFLRTAWAKAAAILIIFGIGAYFYYTAKPRTEMVDIKPSPVLKDILPGSDKAMLTLADGTTIILDTASNGQLVMEGGSAITKNNGQIIYNLSSDNSVSPFSPFEKGGGAKHRGISLNTMSTPRGGQYRLILPDGTKVWLNAASSITYPTVFTGKERNVKITGEAYFEVSKDKTKPFKVQINNSGAYPPLAGVAQSAGGGPGFEIEVLGTSFNVNTYSDEPFFKASLLDGSIKINNTILKPGQAFGNNKLISTNLSQDIAWKNGIFDFEDLTVPEAMRQLARWYDLEIKYSGAVTEKVFGGTIGRNLTLAQVIKGLDGVTVHLKLEGRVLYVSP